MTNLLNVDIKYLLLILLIIFSLTHFIYDFYNNYKKIAYTTDEYKKSALLFAQYLDHYYVRNKFHTISCVVIYFCGIIIPVFLVRIMFNNSLQKQNTIFPIEYDTFLLNKNTFAFYLLYIILLIATTITFKKLLDLMFYKELIKLHIFLHNTLWYCKMESIFHNHHFRDFIGGSYLFLCNVSKLQSWFEGVHIDEYVSLGEHQIIYDNQTVKLWSEYLIELSKEYKMFHQLIIVLRKMFAVIYYRLIGINLSKKIIYISYFTCFIYDFIHSKVFYSFYGFFILYFIILYNQAKKFYSYHNSADRCLNEYFYNNAFSYIKQREVLFNNTQEFMKNITKTRENRNVFSGDHVFDYVFNNFVDRDLEELMKTSSYKSKIFNANIRRYIFVTCNIIALGFLLNFTGKYYLYSNHFIIPIEYIAVILIILQIYFVLNIYNSSEENLEDDWNLYQYDRKYHMFFGVTSVLLWFIFYLTLIKSTLFFAMDNILLEWSFVKIIIKYTMEEKIAFFQNYLNKILIANHATDDVSMLIKNFVEELQIENYIFENTTLNELKQFVVEIITRFSEEVRKFNEYILAQTDILEKRLHRKNLIRSIMDCISNIINLVCFCKFFASYIPLWHIVSNPRDPDTINLIKKLILDIYRIYKRRR